MQLSWNSVRCLVWFGLVACMHSCRVVHYLPQSSRLIYMMCAVAFLIGMRVRYTCTAKNDQRFVILIILSILTTINCASYGKNAHEIRGKLQNWWIYIARKTLPQNIEIQLKTVKIDPFMCVNYHYLNVKRRVIIRKFYLNIQTIAKHEKHINPSPVCASSLKTFEFIRNLSK